MEKRRVRARASSENREGSSETLLNAKPQISAPENSFEDASQIHDSQSAPPHLHRATSLE
jgi:hypothetical protein